GRPETMSPEELKLFAGDADIDGYWVDYQQKGHRVELVGTEEVDGKQVHHLKATLKGGRVVDAYLDAESGLDVTYRLREFMSDLGREADLEVRFSDYREEGGVNMYHTIEQLIDGSPYYVITVGQVEMNPELPEGFFSKPAGTP
ncbi:MAG: hypothetical protein JW990_02115, partial [Thermoleophilia bacterium]|nr:hypothetical protein [Thermoleophilia bacterium]